MERGQLAVIFAVAIVASILSSVITANITGNAIKVTPVVNGTDIYTKAEIDSKINTLNAQINTINSQISTLKNWFGSLTVTSTPIGAAVSVDSVSRGTTPYIIYGLSVGSHDVVVSKSGYLPYSSKRTVYAGSNYLNVTLTLPNATTGSLYVYSIPANASLYVDYVYKGLTPYTVAGLSVGNHNVALTSPGYSNYSTTKYIYAGSNAINVSLTPA